MSTGLRLLESKSSMRTHRKTAKLPKIAPSQPQHQQSPNRMDQLGESQKVENIITATEAVVQRVLKTNLMTSHSF